MHDEQNVTWCNFVELMRKFCDISPIQLAKHFKSTIFYFHDDDYGHKKAIFFPKIAFWNKKKDSHTENALL